MIESWAMSRLRIATWSAVALLIGIAQGPLIWLLFQGHDADTILAVFRHAPNQFVFLLIFFPAVAFVIKQIVVRLHSMSVEYPEAENSRLIRLFVKRGFGYVLALVIGVVIAATDSLETSADFYGKAPEVVERAAQANARLATLEGPEDPEYPRLVDDLSAAYAAPDAGQTLGWLEFAELLASAFVASLIGVACLTSLRLRLLAAGNERLKSDIRKISILLVLAALSFAPWCPLRAHNIGEIRAVLGSDYLTTEPIGILLLLLVVVLYALITFYENLWIAAKVLRKIWGGLIALGGMGAITWFTFEPDFLSDLLQLLTIANLMILAIAVFMLGFLLASLFQVDQLEGAASRLGDD